MRYTIIRTITTKLLYTDEIAHFIILKLGLSLVADLDLFA